MAVFVCPLKEIQNIISLIATKGTAITTPVPVAHRNIITNQTGIGSFIKRMFCKILPNSFHIGPSRSLSERFDIFPTMGIDFEAFLFLVVI
jgi:hypothetical protein